MNAACNREATVNDELSRQVRGVTRNGRSDRLTVQCARLVHDGVRIAALKTDGSLALAAHVMEGAEGLDAHRQDLAGQRSAAQHYPGRRRSYGARAGQKIQMNLFNEFGT